jgi:hypothetical protein
MFDRNMIENLHCSRIGDKQIAAELLGIRMSSSIVSSMNLHPYQSCRIPGLLLSAPDPTTSAAERT